MSIPTTKKSTNIPTIAAAVIGIMFGYGIGNFQGNAKSGALTEQLETAQEQVKRGTEAIANVEIRSDQLNAHRLTALSLVNLDMGNTALATDDLDQVASLLRKQKEANVQAMSKKAASLAQKRDSLKSHRADILSLLASFDTLIPRATGRAAPPR